MLSVDKINARGETGYGRGMSVTRRFLLLISFIAVSFFGFELRAQTGSIAVAPDVVCQNGTSPVITFTGNGGTAEYTFTYSINGGTPITTGTSNGGEYTLNVPTNIAGNFTYDLISIQDNGGAGTPVLLDDDVTVTVVGNVTVDLTPLTSQFCFNAAVPSASRLHFDINNGNPAINYAIQWQWSDNGGGSWNNINPDAGAPTFLTPPTNTPGSRLYRVVLTPNVAGCAQAISNTVTVNVSAALDPGTINTTGGTFCVGWTQTFNNITGASGDGPFTYLWQESVGGCGGPWNDAPGTNNNASYTRNSFPSPGTYCYRRRATDACGSSAFTATVTVTVVPELTSQTVNPMPAGPVCAGQNVSASFTGGGGGAPGLFVDVYQFSTDGGNTWQTYTPVNNISTTGLSGNNIVQVRTRREATGVAGCNFGTYNTYSWTVNAAPATPAPTYIEVGFPTPINPSLCVGDNFQLLSNVAPGTVTYNWTGPGGFTSAAPNPTRNGATINMAGTYNLTISLNGCTSNQGSVNVVISDNPAVPAISGGPLTFCSGGNVTLTSSSATGNQWYLNGNPIAGATGQNYSATAAGNYTVTVTNAGNCSATSAAVTVVVNPAPPTPAITADGPTTFCENQATLLFTTATGYTYQWFVNGTPVVGNFSSILPPTSGTYTLRLFDGTCLSGPSNSINVIINSLPNVSPISGSSNNVCVGGTLALSNATGGGSWSSSNTAVATVNGSGVVSGVAAGGAIITYTVSANGCQNAVTYPVNVITLPVPPNAQASATTICVGQTTSLSSTGTPNSFATQTFCNGTDDGFLNGNPIGPGNWAEQSVNVTGIPAGVTMSQLTNISVQVSITHPSASEVEIYLIPPWGSLNNSPGNAAPPDQNTQSYTPGNAITLSSDNGGNGNNYNNTIFTSGAAPPITGGIPPFNGTYSPEESFNSFPGGNNPNGTWTLRVIDDVNSGDVGTLTNWCITFTYGSGITYTWTSNPAGGFPGGASTFTGQNPGTVSPPQTTTYTVTTTATGTGCALSSNVTVTVLPIPAITGVTGATVCQGATTANLSYTGATGNPDQYSIVWTGAPGFTDVTNATLPVSPIALTIPAAAAPGTYNGTITVRNSTGNCAGVGVPFTITVVAPTVTAGSSNTVCQSGAPVAIALSGASIGGSATGATWSITSLNPANGGNNGTLNNASDLANASYTPPANYVGVVTLTLTTTAAGGCTPATATRTITVNGISSAGTISGDQTKCNTGSGLSATPLTGTGATAPAGSTITYQWQNSTTPGCTNDFTDIASATGQNYNIPAGQTVTTYYRRIARSDLNGVLCEAISNCVTITVNSATASTFPNQTICENVDLPAFTPTTSASGSGTLTYQWSRNTNQATGCAGPFTAIPNVPPGTSTGVTYNPPGLTQTTYYQLTVTSTLNGNPCPATTTCITITVNPNVTPTFSAIGLFCQNSVAPALPGISTNNITGTWNPATISTATAGTTNYVFTPTAGQCATTQTVAITIQALVTPNFAAIGPLCQNSTPPTLGTTSPNGITGTWAPATISTATAGTTNYVFTPAAGQCANTQTLAITIDPLVTPDFAAIGPLCQNSTPPTLGTTSPNGITGTWAPATISTATPGTTNYVFTPAAGQCANTQTLAITIDPLVTPNFAAIGPLCQNSTPPTLSTTSPNGITGTWAPATISTATPGTINLSLIHI